LEKLLGNIFLTNLFKVLEYCSFSSHEDTDETFAVAEIIKQITAPKKEHVQLINDDAFQI
jgi:hypothetical protein